ncbi:MAG: filamentous hemagglutinin N-terminal domain-containing protein [Elusimicrobia bacterium]|nr:filamentous hemagglutinin N-terminal domain-containing protein [Elusimicrobiota bacterium]
MKQNTPQSSSRWSSGLRILIAALIALPSPLWANPSGGSVVSGTANITSSAGTLTVQQLSNLAILNWRDFSINSGELTKFVQPSTLSAALNRVTGANPSTIYGTLQANGRVYLINPNGITVGPTGVINTQSFVASSLDTSNSAFLAGGDLTFSGSSLAGVSNAGKINALGGDILLVAHTVQNTGSLNAAGGTAGMAAGSEVLFTATGNQRVFVQAGSGAAAVGVDQSGQIQAAAAELAAAGGNIYGLAVNNGGSIQATGVSNVGGHIFLTATGGSVADSGSLSATGQGGQVKVTGGQISLGGNVTSNGAQAYVGPVLLTANDSLTGSGISFQGTVDGAHALTLDAGQGSATFDGAVGGQTPLAALMVSGFADVEGGAITTTGNQTFNDAFMANPSAVITSQAGSLVFNESMLVGNNLTTNSALDTIFSNYNAYPIKIGGNLTSNITSSAGAIKFYGTITSGGDQTYNGPFLLIADNNNTLTSLFGNLNFNGTLNGDYNLTTNSAWNTHFNQAVGGSTPLNSLTSNITGPGGVDFNHGAVTTVFDQTYNGTVNAQQDTALTSNAGNLVFNGPANAGFNLTTNSALNTDFNGPVFLGNSLMARTAGGTINLQGGSVTSGGDQTYNGPVSLGSDNVLSSLYGNLNFDGTVNGGHALTTNSAWNTNFNQAVGGTTPLALLTSNIILPDQLGVNGGPGHINIDGGSLVTSGDQTYNGPVYAQPDTVLTSNAGNLLFNGPVNAGFNLVTNSWLNTGFNGTVFLGDSLTSNINGAAGLINFGADSVVSGGDQTYNGSLFLTTPMTFTSLYGNLTFNGTFNSREGTMNCGFNCSVTANSAWNTAFNLPVGGYSDVGSLTSTAREIFLSGGGIGLTGTATFNGPVMLRSDFGIGGDPGSIIFNGTLDGGYTFNAGTRPGVTFNGAVGSIIPLASLNASGTDETVLLNGGSITTVGDQTYGDYAVLLGSDNTLTSTKGNITFTTFNGGLNYPNVNGGYNLTTNSYLNTTFSGQFGGNSYYSNAPLKSLTANITGPGKIDLNASAVTTVNDQTYNGPIMLGADDSLTSQNGRLEFNGTIDGAQNFTTTSSGNTDFFRPVGSVTPLQSLTANITGPGGIYLHGNTVTTTGAQTYNGPLTR